MPDALPVSAGVDVDVPIAVTTSVLVAGSENEADGECESDIVPNSLAVDDVLPLVERDIKIVTVGNKVIVWTGEVERSALLEWESDRVPDSENELEGLDDTDTVRSGDGENWNRDDSDADKNPVFDEVNENVTAGV